ncbi:transporter [Rhizobium rhizosphaerae]|uniref:Transporter n=1 Tax=Xaviernesmea rhizosphaerae TaxID=1672749 RepID=A0A1Q9AJN3_9HYPH|nr:AEC family transporter [Xaviernesmea rhizosphaerae]OLP55447.1 transporter [Xaviernesmea rhizosphaerae]
MSVIFESLVPIFLLVACGVWLKRVRFIAPTLWEGLEQLGYYILFPALLFSTLATAQFGGLKTDATALATIGGVLAMSGLVLALRPLLAKRGVPASTFTSLFQTATRWNGFMALAAAERLYGTTGLTLTALVMTLIIVPINFVNIGVLIWFNGGPRSLSFFALRILSNPMVAASLVGIALNLAGITVYAPVMSAVRMLAESSLPLGLIMVGAGLRLADLVRPEPLVFLSSLLKLIVMPVFMVGFGAALGLSGDALLTIALGASVPTAMNGYLLAKQMGGDAPFYAVAATLQMVASFLTIPLVLSAAAYFAAG